MLPKSEELEALWAIAKKLEADLKKIKNAEITQQGLKNRLAACAREWLRVSPSIHAAGICNAETLNTYDRAMSEVLNSTGSRSRASAVRKKLEPFVAGATDSIVIPVIQHEGSPRQVAARQILETLQPVLSDDEVGYVEEAARCVTVQAHRAALIMLWAAAIARVHGAVTRIGFDAYNKAIDVIAPRKGQPFSRVNVNSKLNSLAELQCARDADILVVGMELFGYDLQVFQELDRLLGARNDAAHPGMASPGALDVQQFATKLRALVFESVR
jgi:hypothetical protein